MRRHPKEVALKRTRPRQFESARSPSAKKKSANTWNPFGEMWGEWGVTYGEKGVSEKTHKKRRAGKQRKHLRPAVECRLRSASNPLGRCLRDGESVRELLGRELTELLNRERRLIRLERRRLKGGWHKNKIKM